MTREECTERIEQITRLLENFREEHVLAHKHTATMATLIMQYEQELKQLRLQQKPKYTAKDFPCLDVVHEYGLTRILYHDGKYEYEIAKTRKHSTKKLIQAPAVFVNEHIDIVPWKISDIGVGDYFARIDADQFCGNYKYCTNRNGDLLEFDYGSNGYIHNGSINISKQLNPNCVKFILK